MSTDEIKNWLINQYPLWEKFSDMFHPETWAEMIQEYPESKMKSELLNPKKWKRTLRYKIGSGSEYDGDGSLGWEWEPGRGSYIIPGWEEAIVREFAWVGCPKINPDGDMIRYSIAEKEGKILGVEFTGD